MKSITFHLLLWEDCCDKLDAEGKNCIERIITATRRMGQLIDDLLNLAGMTRTEMRREKVNLSKNVRKIADGLRKFTLNGKSNGLLPTAFMPMAMSNC